MDETASVGVPPELVKDATALMSERGGLTAAEIRRLWTQAGYELPPLYRMEESLDAAVGLGLVTLTDDGTERRYRAPWLNASES